MITRRNYVSARRNGSAMVMTLAVALFFGLAISFSHSVHKGARCLPEQRAAIDVASLAAAKDLSKIVVEDPYFGFIALSDYAPSGKHNPHRLFQSAGATTDGHADAGVHAAWHDGRDGFPMPVRSINTIWPRCEWT